MRKSIRYHARRRAWYDGLHSHAMIIAAVAGSSTFATIIAGSPQIAEWLALIVAVATIMDTTLRWPEKARVHDTLYRRFHELARAINDNEELTEKKLAYLQNQRLEIETDEPSNLEALNVICHNIQAEAEGQPHDQLYHIRWYQRMFCNICTLPPDTFNKRRHKPST